MYNQNPRKGLSTIYNTPKMNVNEKQIEKKNTTQPEIKLLREAHITEITLGDQKLRVMDASHIQGVINMMEKQHNDIKQLQKTINTQNRALVMVNQQLSTLKSEVDELKRKMNGNYL